MNKATEIIEKWLSENKMTPNTKKSHIVNIKGAVKANPMGSPLEPAECQRELGLIVHQNLYWSENCQTLTIHVPPDSHLWQGPDGPLLLTLPFVLHFDS